MASAIESLRAHLTRPRRPVELAIDCLLFGLCLLGIAYLLAKTYQVSGQAGYDIKFIWLAGEAWQRGANPYAAEYYALGQQLVTSGNVPDLWAYPPNWFLPSVMIALADLNAASVIWSLANVCMVVAASAALTAAISRKRIEIAFWRLPFGLDTRQLATPWNLFFLHVFLISILHPTALTVSVGQTSILIYFGVSLLLYGLASDRQWASVLGLSIALLKPQIGALICIALIMRRAHWMVLVKAAVVSVAISVPAFIVAPTAAFDFLANLTRYDAMWSASWPQSTTGLRHLFWSLSDRDPGNLVFMVVAVLLGAGLILSLLRARPEVDGAELVTVAAGVTLAAAPLHVYDLVLAGTLLVVLARAGPRDMAIGLFGAALMWRAGELAKLTGFYGHGTEHFEGTRLATLGAIFMLIAVFLTVRRCDRGAAP